MRSAFPPYACLYTLQWLYWRQAVTRPADQFLNRGGVMLRSAGCSESVAVPGRLIDSDLWLGAAEKRRSQSSIAGPRLKLAR